MSAFAIYGKNIKRAVYLLLCIPKGLKLCKVYLCNHFFEFPCRICMPSIFSTMSQNHLRPRSWAILLIPSGPSTRCTDLQRPQLRWVMYTVLDIHLNSVLTKWVHYVSSLKSINSILVTNRFNKWYVCIYMYTCILRSLFTSIFSSSFVGPNIPQRWGHHAAGVGKAEATQGKETFEHQRRPDQGGHD